ncbi:DNA polymerase V [Novimethylophilus kurashikiensis]|uniref:DNA polymerase V n=1 Tax=Novimethylophilus kurashikiensis TaxID=1825523 RepID=A0A2R5F854_9PROT|nr:Y-family DNA polymerase [Novimethylophilus kurashikiensis]GBG14215.1 DNA polymerase V [Novimethylophilus kurashikiensis]
MRSTSSPRPVFALADVNSMYCSCERAFRPDLHKTPIVVLSNNDGCVIAQTKEVKALGIEMAQPWFEVEKQARAIGVVAFSSNYEMYASFSNRFVETLRHFAPRIEVYSIDECFMDLTGLKLDLEEYGRKIKDTVLEWTSLPICVGIGHSKTLAKLANKVAKKQERFGGVCDFTSMSEAELDALLEKLDVDKVWGVGRRYAERLNSLGVRNVLRLKRANPRRVRDEFGVVLMRTVQELNGIACHELTEEIEPSKQVMSSRSFGQRVSSLQGLREAISFHAATATARLREQRLYAQAVHCFIQNSPFDERPYFGRSLTIALPSPTNDTFKVTEAALMLLERMYAPKVYYQKAGVMLMELVPVAGQQMDLLGYSDDAGKAESLMTAIDKINERYGRHTVRLASQGYRNDWAMRRELKSRNYTADWNELPTIGERFAL